MEENVTGCDCPVCRVLREEFGAAPGFEHKVIGKLLDYIDVTSNALNQVEVARQSALSELQQRGLERGKVVPRASTSLMLEMEVNRISALPRRDKDGI